MKLSDPATQPDAPSVQHQLRRILASREFCASQRMSRFLRLAVTETLAGRPDRLKEYVFGLEVFDRDESFNPAADPIVRVEARRLRTKLEKYYQTDGRHDEIVIELPKGGYVPVFHRRAQKEPEPPASSSRKIAVLPFVELAASPDGTSFGDGLTWELIHGLTRIEGLAVLAWHSAEQLRHGQQDIRSLHEKLQVEAVLVGSVRRSANRLRVMAQLIDAASGVYVWSETYDRGLEDAADIQQEISRAIVAKLKIRLAGADWQHRSVVRYCPDAYQLYLRGRGQWSHRTEQGLRDALLSFQQAVALDAEFALAHAGVADAYTLLAEYGLADASVVMPQARAAALRALDIDPSLGEAHCSLALLFGTHEWKWAEAEAHYRRALDLNPGYAPAHHWFACDFLTILGRLDEAMREIEIAQALDPLSPIIAEGKAFVLVLQRRHDEAIAHLREILRAEPSFYKGHTGIGRALIQLGRYDEAIVNLERGAAIAGDVAKILGALGQAYGLAGQQSRAREILRQLESLQTRRHVPATSFALIHLGLDDRQRALDYLEAGFDRRESNVALLAVHPAYDALRGEPRFEKLVARLGLPELSDAAAY